MRILSLRMTGCDVGMWQQFLKSKSLYSRQPDGRFDTRQRRPRSNTNTGGALLRAALSIAIRSTELATTGSLRQ